MAARKKAEKPKRPDAPGRFIPGWDHDESQHEEVRFVIDDARMAADRARIREIEQAEQVHNDEVRAAKAKLSGLKREREELTTGLVHGYRESYLRVFRFADDEAGIVRQYDAETHELLGERPLDDDDRQESLDLEADEDADEDADESEGEDE